MNEGGIQKSAVLLLALGESAAREIMAYLSPSEAQRIASAVAAIGAISPQEQDKVLREFELQSQNQDSLPTPSDTADRSEPGAQLNNDPSDDKTTNVQADSPSDGIAQLAELPAQEAARAIENEHPQAIAAILGRLEASHASAIAECFGPLLRADVMRRNAASKPIQPDALDEIEAALTEILSNRKTLLIEPEAAADTLLHTEQRTAELLERLSIDAGGLLAQAGRLTAFEQIGELDTASLRQLLREAPQDSLLIALKGADSALVDKIAAATDQAAARQLCDALAATGPVRVGAIEVEQLAILRLATRIATSREAAH